LPGFSSPNHDVAVGSKVDRAQMTQRTNGGDPKVCFAVEHSALNSASDFGNGRERDADAPMLGHEGGDALGEKDGHSTTEPSDPDLSMYCFIRSFAWDESFEGMLCAAQLWLKEYQVTGRLAAGFASEEKLCFEEFFHFGDRARYRRLR